MFNYRKLWIRLAERDMKKKDLSAMAGVSPNVITKLGRGESVTTDVLGKICRALDCDVGDIMELPKQKKEEK